MFRQCTDDLRTESTSGIGIGVGIGLVLEEGERRFERGFGDDLPQDKCQTHQIGILLKTESPRS